MAEDKKEMTKEEKEAEFKKMQDFQMQVLRTDYGIIGSNYAKLNGGKMGSSVADNYMNTDQNVLKIRQQLYAEGDQEYKKAGIAWDAVMPDNGAVAYYAKQMTGPALQTLTLGNLEKIVNEIDPKAGLKVADKFKGLTLEKINEMAEKAGEKPSEELKEASTIYTLLTASYEKTAAMNIMNKSYLSNEKAVLDSIAEKYKPREPKKDEGKKK
jgi:hypothetical protein